MEGLTDREIGIDGKTYNVIVYRCAEHGGWRAEAARAGHVVEVIDVPREHEALPGLIKVLARRNGAG